MIETLTLKELEFSERQLADISADQKAALAAVSHSINELNVLRRIFIYCSVAEPPANEFGISALIQQLTILRLWSAKLYELQEFVEFRGKYNRTSDPLLRDISKSAKSTFADLKSEQGYRMTERFRHEATNHLSLRETKANLEYVSSGAKTVAMLTEGDGNCFFPYGEDVVFGGRLARFWDELKMEPSNSVDIWFDWNTRAHRWATNLHISMMNKIASRTDLIERNLELKLNSEFVGDATSRQIPIYTRKTK